ncbi:MAG: hypothetical protein ACYDH3_00305 [Candidatus Aminicenantales bacterium]
MSPKSVAITGIDKLRAGLKEINTFLESTKPMAGFVEGARVEILVKTASGKDYKGASFAPYSKEYAKRKAGMTATGRPNLKKTGVMLNNLYAKAVDAKHGKIDIMPGAEPGGGGINSALLAHIHHTGTGKQPERAFLDLNETQIKKLKKKHWDDPLLEMAKKLR